MKSFINLTLLLTLIPLHSAFAQGDHSGGGGDIVICEAPKKHQSFFGRLFEKRKMNYFLLDVYEAEKTSGRKLNLGGPELSMAEKIKLAYDDYAKLDPIRAKRYYDEALIIAAELQMQESGHANPNASAVLLDQRLADIPDAREDFKFLECTRKQLVRQQQPSLNPDSHVSGGAILRAAFYTFDSKWWSKLDRDNKVAAIYHEVIYRELREYGVRVSPAARQLNSFVISRQSNQLSFSNYLNFISVNGAKVYVFRSNVGDFTIRNLDNQQGLWSATVTEINSPGYISEVNIPYSQIDESKLPYAPLNLKATSLSFNERRELTTINGTFSISYDPTKRRLIDTQADCTISAYPCLTTTNITAHPDGTFSISAANGQILIFDHEGKIISAPVR